MKFLCSLLLVLFGFNLFAHEGAHGPAQKMAPHGGSLFDGKNLMGELVQDEQGVKIYFLKHDTKAINASEIQIDKSKVTLIDSKNKEVAFELVGGKEFISINFDRSKSYRFNLAVPLLYGKNKDNLSWGFEPQPN